MKTVLVVDDYASVRFYHLSLLRSAGFQTAAAANGADALALLEKQNVDLVMLDLLMPTMNGREVVRRIRAMPRHVGLPILVVTSEADHADLVDIKVDPACRIMTKPILPATLLQEVNRCIH